MVNNFLLPPALLLAIRWSIEDKLVAVAFSVLRPWPSSAANRASIPRWKALYFEKVATALLRRSNTSISMRITPLV